MNLVTQAFGSDEGLYKKILQAISEKPSQQQLFDEIAAYCLQQSQSATNGAPSDPSDEPATKKRKLANGSIPVRNADSRSELVLELREVSFSIPQRKKFHLRIVQYTASDSTTTLGVQAVNPADDTVEYELPSSELAQVLRMPVPEKATKQFNYVFVPIGSSSYEPILFTVPATPPKGGTYTFPPSASNLEEALAQVLQRHDLSLTVPDEKEFASATPESHRKSEKAFHVKAFRGSKDGFLFFLANGIFFGFKKPLLFLPLHDIESISYTSVLQRTFNLNIAYRKSEAAGAAPAEPEEEEIEFSMLDQSDYSGINDYIQRHGLNDASLAAGRRAKSETKKKANNAANEDAVADDNEEPDGRTELEKAEQQLQDDEDEMEEDFEPSDEDDDGSGSDAESDDDDVPAPRKSARNLVEDELGSEAEDVEITDEEDEAEDGGDDEEEEEPEVEADVDPVPVSKPNSRPQHQQPIVQARWGAAINSQPDPDDEDQL